MSDRYSLTGAQSGMWFAQQLGSGESDIQCSRISRDPRRDRPGVVREGVAPDGDGN